MLKVAVHHDRHCSLSRLQPFYNSPSKSAGLLSGLSMDAPDWDRAATRNISDRVRSFIGAVVHEDDFVATSNQGGLQPVDENLDVAALVSGWDDDAYLSCRYRVEVDEARPSAVVRPRIGQPQPSPQELKLRFDVLARIDS